MVLFFWFDLFLEARAEIQKYFCSFFGANENSWSLFKITDLYKMFSNFTFFSRLNVQKKSCKIVHMYNLNMTSKIFGSIVQSICYINHLQLCLFFDEERKVISAILYHLTILQNIFWHFLYINHGKFYVHTADDLTISVVSSFYCEIRPIIKWQQQKM